MCCERLDFNPLSVLIYVVTEGCPYKVMLCCPGDRAGTSSQRLSVAKVRPRTPPRPVLTLCNFSVKPGTASQRENAPTRSKALPLLWRSAHPAPLSLVAASCSMSPATNENTFIGPSPFPWLLTNRTTCLSECNVNWNRDVFSNFEFNLG